MKLHLGNNTFRLIYLCENCKELVYKPEKHECSKLIGIYKVVRRNEVERRQK